MKKINLVTCTVVFAALLLSAGTAVAEKYYKVVRADGSIEYTNTPPSSSARPVDLPGLSIISPERKEEIQAETGPREDSAEATAKAEKRDYSGLAITSPANEENLWGTADSVEVRVDLPDLAPGHRLVVSLDGADFPPIRGSSITLNNVFRGEHTLVAKIVDRRGKVLASSAPVTFYMMKQTVKPPPASPGRGG